MKKEDAEEYTQSLGQIMSGGWRQIELAQRLGVPKALGLSTREWVEERLGGYVRLNVAERKEATKELLANGLSQRQTAEVLGVNERTVRNDRGAEKSASKPDPTPERAEKSAPPKPGKPTSKRALAAEQHEREIDEQRQRRADRLYSFLNVMPEFVWYANPPENDSKAAAERAAVIERLRLPDQERIAYYVENLNTEKLEIPE